MDPKEATVTQDNCEALLGGLRFGISFRKRWVKFVDLVGLPLGRVSPQNFCCWPHLEYGTISLRSATQMCPNMLVDHSL